MSDGNDVKLQAMIEAEVQRQLAPFRAKSNHSQDRMEDQIKNDIAALVERVDTLADRLNKTREEFAKMSGRHAILVTVAIGIIMILVEFGSKALGGG
jgi:hypothetical protein